MAESSALSNIGTGVGSGTGPPSRRPAEVFLCEDDDSLDESALRAKADLAFLAGRNALALELYGIMVARGCAHEWPHLQLGRLRRCDRDLDGARAAFLVSVRLAPQSRAAWYEVLRVYLELADLDNLDTAAKCFAAADVNDLTAEHAPILVSVAHFLFDKGRHETGFCLYAIIYALGTEDGLAQARHAEGRVRQSDFATGLQILEPLYRSGKLVYRSGQLNKRGVHALARACGALDQPETACELYELLFKSDPGNFHVAMDYIRLLVKLGKAEQARSHLEAVRTCLPTQHYDDLKHVLLSESGDFDNLLVLIEIPTAIAGPEGLRAVDRAIASCTFATRNFELARKLLDARIGRYGWTDRVIAAAVHVAISTHDLAMAGEWLSKASDDLFAADPKLRLAQFQYHCLSGEIELARKALELLRPFDALPPYFLRTVINQFADLNDWSGVCDIALDHLGADFLFEQTGFVVLDAIRRTDRHSQFLLRLEDAISRHDTPSLRKLRVILREDIADSPSALSSLLEEASTDEFEPVRERLVFKRVVAAGGVRTDVSKRTAIYFCADSAYLGPALVSLTSLLNSNCDMTERSEFFVVVDDVETCLLARRLTEKLSQRYAVSITVLERGTVRNGEFKLKTDYGMPARGRSLPESAYDRIYVTQMLRREGRHDKALYLDSDTIIAGNLNPLLDRAWDVPLMARLELPRPQVEIAIRRHELPSGQYFNSGVLAFRLDHPELGAALERTVHAMHHQQDKLLYHDQCALNIGFKGQFEALEPRYNMLLVPDDPEPDVDGIILHYFDRPKPWDPAYRGKRGRQWFLNWYQLALHIGSDDAFGLYKMASRR